MLSKDNFLAINFIGFKGSNSRSKDLIQIVRQEMRVNQVRVGRVVRYGHILEVKSTASHYGLKQGMIEMEEQDKSNFLTWATSPTQKQFSLGHISFDMAVISVQILSRSLGI